MTSHQKNFTKHLPAWRVRQSLGDGLTLHPASSSTSTELSTSFFVSSLMTSKEGTEKFHPLFWLDAGPMMEPSVEKIKKLGLLDLIFTFAVIFGPLKPLFRRWLGLFALSRPHDSLTITRPYFISNKRCSDRTFLKGPLSL